MKHTVHMLLAVLGLTLATARAEESMDKMWGDAKVQAGIEQDRPGRAVPRRQLRHVHPLGIVLPSRRPVAGPDLLRHRRVDQAADEDLRGRLHGAGQGVQSHRSSTPARSRGSPRTPG